MPATRVVLFAEENGSVPFYDWLDSLPQKAQDKCIVRIERLAACGHELRRPEADLLRDGIYELRARWGHVHYRTLYFFHEQSAVVSHGLSKEGKVPDTEIDRALKRKREFESDPGKHTHGE